MRNLFFSICISILVFGCANNNEDNLEIYEPNKKEVKVTMQASSNIGSRVSYEPTDESYLFKWDAGEKIQIRIPDTDNDDTDGYGSGGVEFTTELGGESAAFEGVLTSWSGEKTIYAINPYGYTPDIQERNGVNVIEVVNSMSVQSGSSSKVINGYNTGYLVAKSDGATLVSENEYYFPQLNFKQVCAFLQIKINDIPDDVNIYDIYLGSYNTTNEIFPDEVYVDMATGEVTEVRDEYMRSELVWGVSDFNNENNIITIAMLPADASNYTLVLGINTDLFYNLNKGVNFERNTVYYKELSYSDFAPLSITTEQNSLDCNGEDLSFKSL